MQAISVSWARVQPAYANVFGILQLMIGLRLRGFERRQQASATTL